MGELVPVRDGSIARTSAMPTADDLTSMRNVAQIFVDAGMFEVSAKEAEKGITPEKKLAMAQVKIMAGSELGITPWAAIKGMHIVKGKCVPGYQILLAKVRMTPGYDYRMLQWDRETCRIEFTRNGKSLGVSEFGTKDMQQSGLGGDMYSKFMKNMFVARATSNGISALCPEVVNGAPSHTPESFGYVETEDGELINCEVDVKTGEVTQAKEPPKVKRLARVKVEEKTEAKELDESGKTDAGGVEETLKSTPAPAATQAVANAQAAPESEQAEEVHEAEPEESPEEPAQEQPAPQATTSRRKGWD